MLETVQLRGGARRPRARRSRSGSLALARISGFARLATGCGWPSVSVRPRPPYLADGLFQHPAGASDSTPTGEGVARARKWYGEAGGGRETMTEGEALALLRGDDPVDVA